MYFTYVCISSSVVSYTHVPPEGVKTDGGEENIRVVSLMVMANPGSYESPEGLIGWVGTESADLLWLSSYNMK